MLLVIVVLIFSFISKAQVTTFHSKDSIKYVIKPFSYYSNQNKINKVVPEMDLSLNRYQSIYRYTLYNDTLHQKWMLYDNYRHEYFYNDPITPYGSFRKALVLGTLNYLFRAFDNK